MLYGTVRTELTSLVRIGLRLPFTDSPFVPGRNYSGEAAIPKKEETKAPSPCRRVRRPFRTTYRSALLHPP